MAIVNLSTGAKNAVANAIAALIDAGTGPGKLRVYDGAIPATANDPVTGVLMAEFTLNDPAAAAAVAGVATVNLEPDLSTTILATSTATHFRIVDSAGATVLDGDVAVTGASLNFDSVTWTEGGIVYLADGTVTG